MRHDSYAKEWGTLGSQGLTPIGVSCELLIKSSKLQGVRIGAGTWRVGEEAISGIHVPQKT